MPLPHRPDGADTRPADQAEAAEDYQRRAAGRLRDAERGTDGLRSPVPESPPPGYPVGRVPILPTTPPDRDDSERGPLPVATPPSPHFNPDCAGCRDAQFRIETARRSLSSYIGDGARAHSDLAELRRGLVGHLTRRHPDRVDHLARQRQALSDATANDTLLFLLCRWDEERDARIVDDAIAGLRRELETAHADVTELRDDARRQRADFAAQRQELSARVDAINSALASQNQSMKAVEERLRATQGFARIVVNLLDAAGGHLPKMPRKLDYYTGAARAEQPTLDAAQAETTAAGADTADTSREAGTRNDRARQQRGPRRAPAEPRSDTSPGALPWADAALRAIHAGTAWHRRMLDTPGSSDADVIATLQMWRQQKLVEVIDRDYGCGILPGPSLTDTLGTADPPTPSLLAQALEPVPDGAGIFTTLLTRALVNADKLYTHLEIVPSGTSLPVIAGKKVTQGGERVFVIPWLPSYPGLVTDALRNTGAARLGVEIGVVVSRDDTDEAKIDERLEAAGVSLTRKTLITSDDTGIGAPSRGERG